MLRLRLIECLTLNDARVALITPNGTCANYRLD
jgi:hypothetical protein